MNVMFALRLTQNAEFPYNVTFEGSKNIAVGSWCVLPYQNGNEMRIMIFDGRPKSLLNFELA